VKAKKHCLVFLLLVGASVYGIKTRGAESNSQPIRRQNTSGQEIATISVTDQQGNILSNLKVIEMVSMQEYTTDDNGRFTCDLSDKTRYFYTVYKERKLVNRGTLKPGQKQLHIPLEPGRVVSGKVIDTNGKPVRGTTIETKPMSPCVSSDNDGNFVIGWLPSWELRSGICLIAQNSERNLAAIVDISRQTESIEIQLAPALTLKGTVTDSKGKPVSGARMILALRKWTWGIFITKRIHTDDEGRFEFPVLPQLQDYELHIGAENYLYESFTIGHLNTIKETEELTPIVLHKKQDTADGIKYGLLLLNIVDEDGKPIDIMEIQLWDAKDHPSANKETFIATSTDKPGFYRIEEIPTGYYHVISIHKEGYAPFQQTDVLIEKDSTNTINCILSRGSTIKGLVVNEQGRPVKGIPVLIKSPLYCRRDLITDENGRFYADYMPDMHYSVVAEPESESPYETTVFRGDVLCSQKDIKIVVQNKKGTRLRTSLIGENLPGFNDIKIDLAPNASKDKLMLLCFFDVNQRPSRNCLQQLNKSAQELKVKDVSIVAVQTSKVEQDALNEWLKSQNISFPVGIVSNDEQAIRFTWCVKSLPWLILTDRQHIVRAVGFGISELSSRLEEAGRPIVKEEIERRRRTIAESEIERLGGSIVKACENDVNYTEVTLLGPRYRRQWTGGDWGVSYLNDLANLRKLRIQDVETFTDEGMKHLKGLQSLEFLMLVRTGVSDEGLIHLKDLTKLEFLGLISNKFTDAGLEHITGMTELKSLRLDDTRITDGGLQRLKQCGILTRLEFLVLSRTQITNAGLAYLQGMDRLRRLYIGGTRIGDEGISYLAKLSKLEVLILDDTNVTDAGLAHLRGLKNLNMLYLQNTQITDAGLEHLKESANLVELWLGGTKITDAGLAHIQGLTSLQSVSLERTAVTDKGLTYLKPLTAMRELFLKQSNITIDGYMDLKEVLPDCQIYWEEKKNNDSA
jgi:protocatechuate 3,4-dioxygenase beta subunit